MAFSENTSGKPSTPIHIVNCEIDISEMDDIRFVLSNQPSEDEFSESYLLDDSEKFADSFFKLDENPSPVNIVLDIPLEIEEAVSEKEENQDAMPMLNSDVETSEPFKLDDGDPHEIIEPISLPEEESESGHVPGNFEKESADFSIANESSNIFENNDIDLSETDEDLEDAEVVSETRQQILSDLLMEPEPDTGSNPVDPSTSKGNITNEIETDYEPRTKSETKQVVSSKPPLILSREELFKTRKTRKKFQKLGKKSKSKSASKKPAFKKQNFLTTSISLKSLFENSRLLGLDIGTHSLKYVLLKKTAGGLRLIDWGSEPLPQIADDLSKEERIEALADFISGTFKNKNIKNTLIKTVLYGMEVLFKKIEVPKMGSKELAKAVPWACRKDFPFPLESTVFQYISHDGRVKKADGKTEVFVVAAQKELISNHVRLLKNARIIPSKIATVPGALWNLFNLYQKKDADKCYAVVDIGANSSHIIFVLEKQLQFAREVAVGGGDFTEALTGELFIDGKEIKLSYEEAERIKIKYGIPNEADDESTDDDIPLQELAVMIGTSLEKLLNEIQRTVDFFKEKFRVEAVEKIYVTGGGALMPNLLHSMERELNIKVESLNPFDVISSRKFENRQELQKLGPSFAVAAGLALDKSKELNLLPPELKGSYMFQFIKKMYRYVLVILLLSMVLFSQKALRQFENVENEFNRLNSQYQSAEPKRSEFIRLQQELQKLIGMKKSYRHSLNIKTTAADHFKAISHLIPANVTLTSFKVTYKKIPIPETENEFTIQEMVVLNGVAFESNSMEGINLAKLLLELEKSDYFYQISLTSQTTREDGSLEFEIACET